MPTIGRHFCLYPGCPAKVTSTAYCPEHARARDRARGTARERGYDARWDRAARAWLRKPENAFCVYCEAEGRTAASECVDHFVPHKGDRALFWDRSNWRASCLRCNTQKAIRDEGGFGRGTG